ncbi:MAG TPA: heat-inducible transcription repressor HrcA [Nitrospirae bacterium]|nr:heat-inducible transcription repressor HrcA [bacterium BMS3Abin10]GBE38575.1 heat-inducible transcription repressor HrcA [bacterium BMS3Bbin08]HDH50863.1 heat-inducible transcription repressor HrcA [Nitrospirota bacterium]HDK81562.1 heat-inducible transcription repressor HrcA [Nitrospirota bacterium]
MSKLDDRSREILWAIIESYIASNGPVGSRAVTKKYSLGLSPATIRNTMADLEEMGYVTQPHTSAGRIPTEKGYRLYVNSILKQYSRTVNDLLLKQLYYRMRSIEKDMSNLLKETSKTLSAFSHYLGIATSPKAEEITLKSIKFLKYDKHRVFSVLISEEGIVKDKIIFLKESFSQKLLDKAANFLNSELAGLTLREAKLKILALISEEELTCNNLIHNALALCRQAIALETEDMLYAGEISGASNLPDFANMKQIKELFKAIEEKHLMVTLLDKMIDSEGVQVFIGSENSYSEMNELTMVGSTYNDGSRVLGTLGIIGPTRMNYEKIIPIVDLTAKTLTRILSKK